MQILLTGSTGAIGRRLLPVLLRAGHEVVCLVRDERRFHAEDLDEAMTSRVRLIEGDLTRAESLRAIPRDVEAAYYLVHSMADSHRDFAELERRSATNFAEAIRGTAARQIIYLSGISNEPRLSHHLQSRRDVEETLRASGVPLTVLRAAIVVGPGSASFQIIRDLVEKLPVMVAPKWLKTRCQPIALDDVIEYLSGVLLLESSYGKTLDIGGPDVLTYEEMLLRYAAARGLRREIIPVPVLTPKLSSLWLYFVTEASYPLARSLVDSMRNEVVVKRTGIEDIVPIHLHTYDEALQMALTNEATAAVS
jgi:uncharacterized protein YbjT (DUF2867 family)